MSSASTQRRAAAKPKDTQRAAKASDAGAPHAGALHTGGRNAEGTRGEVLGELDVHLIVEGRHKRLYDVLGCHQTTENGVPGATFAVWAPNARDVSVIGDFNEWEAGRHPMRNHWGCGIWQTFVEGVVPGSLYKFAIETHDGRTLEKADPFAQRAELPPKTASIATRKDPYSFRDEAWLQSRERTIGVDAPVSIYECHLGSWRKTPDEGGWRSLSYRELAEWLIPYVTDMGFTHVELLPVSEYPFGGSWGYQPTGMFAPTSRYGTPDDFAALVDACHQAGIGVIVDWVSAHFPNDAHGLAQFDGSHLYEHQSPLEGYHPDWNSLIYNYGRTEVSNFLRASALYWLDRFHIDGLRVDAVASMLYRDYSRESGEWVPNHQGGRENLEAIAFLKDLNRDAYGQFPGIAMMAEESTAWPGVTKPVHHGGLGFGYKWNMGWMHDSLLYMGRDPIHRRFHHNELSFSLLYSFSENYVLPLSHDEVVHGKGSILSRMPGDNWQRFANMRAYLGWMYGHPGKKLLFMGTEFAQEHQWNHEQSLDWHHLESGTPNSDLHQGMQRLVRDLNHTYRSLGALHARDCDPAGFEWIEPHDADSSVFSFHRWGKRDTDLVLVISNMTPVVRHNFRIGVSRPGRYIERINTDSAHYGGSNVGCDGSLHTEEVSAHGRSQSLRLTLPPLATLILEWEPAG